MNHIYALLDTVARDILGGLHIFRHDAAAVRWFCDLAANEKTAIAAHPTDYELVYIGEVRLDDETGIPALIPAEPRTVLTGSQWQAMTNRAER